jgi:DNA repair exonuclease SbcCD nuclease subunit
MNKAKLKLLHTADLHLGAAFSGLGSQGAQQRQRLREVLNDIADAAMNEAIQLVLIAGDTFDHLRPSPESLQAFCGFVRKMAQQNIPVVMIAGTHDHWAQNDVLPKLQKDFGESLAVLDPGNSIWENSSLGVRIQGISLVRQDEPEHPIALLQREAGYTGWQIGMVHAALDLGKSKSVEARFTLKEIGKTALDYIALGHWHGLKDCSQDSVTAWYSGAPEMIALDEAASGQVLLVQLEEGKPVSVLPRQVGKRSWIHRELEAVQVSVALEQLKKNADPDAVLDLTLTGLVTPEHSQSWENLRQDLAPLFFQVRIHDQTHLECSDEELEKYPETTALGRFIRLMQAEILNAGDARRAELEKALQLGVAYLRGTEVALWS